MEDFLYLIPLLPFIGFLFQAFLGRFFGIATGYLATAVILLSHLLAWAAWRAGPLESQGPVWMQVGGFSIHFSYLFDALSGIMTLFVTGIAALIHLYSVGYMKDDETPWKFFAYLNLFTGMMLMLILGNSLPLLFLGWEGVGLCSYLLIGYWHREMDNAKAAQKAFVANRIGDFFFLIGMFLLCQATSWHSLDFSNLLSLNPEQPQIGWALLCLFLGACGKSAQIPLYVWLPDAMAGPTPVSALIHAATMVTSGLYLLARLSPLYAEVPFVQDIVVIVGAATALLAALIALTQTDIKKVLAYSTVSQLGYMFVAMGSGAFAVGIFHVFTHAFFKALLFLGSGSVILACHHEQDMRQMGGLKSKIPVTHLTMLIGCLAISGLPFMSGFFSKEEILTAILGAHHPLIYAVMLFTAVLTAFYMFRLYFLTFRGEYRGHHEPHESPWQMTLPLGILAVGAVGAGYIAVPHLLENTGAYMSPLQALSFPENSHGPLGHGLLMTLGIGAFVSGLALACWRYGGGGNVPEAGMERKNRLVNLSFQKFFVDEIYETYILTPFVQGARFLHQIGDRLFIEGIVNNLARLVEICGRSLRLFQSGRLGHYALSMMFGVVLILIYLFEKGAAL
jgi:NADH-quinone oxidoreductase subunit L